MEKRNGDTMWFKPFAHPFEELKAVSKERVKAVGTGLDEFMQSVASQRAEGQPLKGDFGLAELEEKLQSLKRKVGPKAPRSHLLRLLPSISRCLMRRSQVEHDAQEEVAAVERCRARIAHIEESTRETTTQKPRHARTHARPPLLHAVRCAIRRRHQLLSTADDESCRVKA